MYTHTQYIYVCVSMKIVCVYVYILYIYTHYIYIHTHTHIYAYAYYIYLKINKQIPCFTAFGSESCNEGSYLRQYKGVLQSLEDVINEKSSSWKRKEFRIFQFLALREDLKWLYHLRKKSYLEEYLEAQQVINFLQCYPSKKDDGVLGCTSAVWNKSSEIMFFHIWQGCDCYCYFLSSSEVRNSSLRIASVPSQST